MNKKTVAVLFGGQSSEHEVSCTSALTIISNINRDLYNVILIGITQEGEWIEVPSVEEILSNEWRQGKTKAIISPDASQKSILLLKKDKVIEKTVDVVFPVLHGLYGEDGTIQGLLELARIPYVGCGVVSSGISMDKLFTKIIVKELGIPQANFMAVLKKELFDSQGLVKREVITSLEKHIPYPMFVKPSNAGSSCGITKTKNQEELILGLLEAVKHDKKILVEETINGREIECAVLGGNEPRASGLGEIIAAADFYDYDAKYNNTESKTIISPELDKKTVETIRAYAVKIFRAVDGYGLSRVDFFVKSDTGEVVFNEINTMPGFTNISMYPMLWEARGIGRPQLVDKLLQLALQRGED